jgi:transposase
MTKRLDTSSISVVHPICCGLDVHKEKISACLISTVSHSGEAEIEIREFGTFTDELVELRKWLLSQDCPIVAMESTGVYWRPIHNVIEGYMEVILVNARHVKNVPGRKTDIADSKWLAELLRHGLLRGSFIPEKEIRQWRELTRARRKITESLSDYKRRVHKLFETANIKIDSVVSDLFGVTGRHLIEMLCNDTMELSLKAIEQVAQGSLRSKAQELHRSIQGFFEEHHRFLLLSIMRVITILESERAFITDRLSGLMVTERELLKRLDEVPGVNEISAQSVLSELGITLKTFICAAALASWAGLCPGNNESAGKRRSGKSAVRMNSVKTIMIEIAWAAVKKKGSYYRDKYYRLRARLGPKKAIVAIAHRLLRAIFHIIKDGASFKDLGEDYLVNKNKNKKIAQLKKQAKQLGFELVPCEA